MKLTEKSPTHWFCNATTFIEHRTERPISNACDSMTLLQGTTMSYGAKKDLDSQEFKRRK
jgi:hypothetical protein